MSLPNTASETQSDENKVEVKDVWEGVPEELKKKVQDAGADIWDWKGLVKIMPMKEAQQVYPPSKEKLKKQQEIEDKKQKEREKVAKVTLPREVHEKVREIAEEKDIPLSEVYKTEVLPKLEKEEIRGSDMKCDNQKTPEEFNTDMTGVKKVFDIMKAGKDLRLELKEELKQELEVEGKGRDRESPIREAMDDVMYKIEKKIAENMLKNLERSFEPPKPERDPNKDRMDMVVSEALSFLKDLGNKVAEGKIAVPPVGGGVNNHQLVAAIQELNARNMYLFKKLEENGIDLGLDQFRQKNQEVPKENINISNVPIGMSEEEVTDETNIQGMGKKKHRGI